MLIRVQRTILGFGLLGAIVLLAVKFVQFERWAPSLVITGLGLLLLFWYLFVSNYLTNVEDWSGTFQWFVQSILFGMFGAAVILMFAIRENQTLSNYSSFMLVAGLISASLYGFFLLPVTYWRETFDDDMRFSVGE
jgi:hypothetical protein